MTITNESVKRFFVSRTSGVAAFNTLLGVAGTYRKNRQAAKKYGEHLVANFLAPIKADDLPLEAIESMLDAAEYRDALMGSGPYDDMEVAALVKIAAWPLASAVLLRAFGFPCRPAWGNIAFIRTSGVLNAQGEEEGFATTYGGPFGHGGFILFGNSVAAGSLGQRRENNDERLMIVEASEFGAAMKGVAFKDLFTIGEVVNSIRKVDPVPSIESTSDLLGIAYETGLIDWIKMGLSNRVHAIRQGLLL